MLVYVVLLFQSLIASGTHIVAKLVVRDIDPVSLTLLRSILAAIGLLVIVGIRKTRLVFDKEHRKAMILLSFLAIPVNQFLFLTGISYSTPSNASLLYGTTPAVVLLISHFTGKEKISWRKWLGVAVAFAGVALVVFEEGIDFRTQYTLGNCLLLIAVFAWALYTVHGQPMILRYGAFPTSAATMLLGTLMFVPVGAVNLLRLDFSLLTAGHWMGLLYLSLGTSIFAYFLWYYALARIPATKVAIFANLQPVLTTVLSMLILGQAVTPVFVAGGITALTGVILAQFG